MPDSVAVIHSDDGQALGELPQAVCLGEEQIQVLEGLDVFRREERLEMFLTACLADARGCKDHECLPYPQVDRYRAAFKAAKAIDAKQFVDQGLKGEAIRNALHEARVQAIAQTLEV